eukprot:1190995-Prorocentrum_minimum.AAC.1
MDGLTSFRSMRTVGAPTLLIHNITSSYGSSCANYGKDLGRPDARRGGGDGGCGGGRGGGLLRGGHALLPEQTRLDAEGARLLQVERGPAEERRGVYARAPLDPVPPRKHD